MKVLFYLLLPLAALTGARVIDPGYDPFPGWAVESSGCHHSGSGRQAVDQLVGLILRSCVQYFAKNCDSTEPSDTCHDWTKTGCITFKDDGIHWELSYEYIGEVEDKNHTLSKASCIGGFSHVVFNCPAGGWTEIEDHKGLHWKFTADPNASDCPELSVEEKDLSGYDLDLEKLDFAERNTSLFD
ncbi:hypothetical protein BU16DRAFT_559101 [Lophium mytilinum]|uniref:Uncharacterized protein n=1 Tax=Lophium mytilinum TaxID=390894 RepID=A0A6A6R055_9PEZI|nr:hypothetical protein BU16DRAFT_559101 [Lophium mytilinum]